MFLLILLLFILIMVIFYLDDQIDEVLKGNYISNRIAPIAIGIIISILIVFVCLYQQVKYRLVVDFCIENNLTDKLIKKYPKLKKDVIEELKSFEKEKLYNKINKKYYKEK